MVKLSLALIGLLLLNGANANPTNKPITVYGLKQGRQLNAGKRMNSQYVLQIGAFSTQANALKCKNQYARKTDTKIQILPPKHAHGPYIVLMGPFSNAAALKNVSQQLLSGKINKSTQTALHLPSEKKVVPVMHNLPVKITPKAELPALTQKSNDTVIAVTDTQPNLPVKPDLEPQKEPVAVVEQKVEAKPVLEVEKKKTEIVVKKPSGLTEASTQIFHDSHVVLDKQVLLDNQTIKNNQIAQSMQATGKMDSKADYERHSIQDRARKLSKESMAISIQLETETNSEKIASLKERQRVIDKERQQIVATVINRISSR